MVNKKLIIIILIISLLFTNVCTAFADTIEQPMDDEGIVTIVDDGGTIDESIPTGDEDRAIGEEITSIEEEAINTTDNESTEEKITPTGEEVMSINIGGVQTQNTPYYEITSGMPKGTVTINYRYRHFNGYYYPAKVSDYYLDVAGTQIYTAPEIEGFTKPVGDTVTVTITTEGQFEAHTFYYNRIGSFGVVDIYYLDDSSNILRDKDMYYDIQGTQIYTAPDIEGYNKPSEDTVTFTITVDGDYYYHYFVYTKILPKGTVIINYHDEKGNSIKETEIYADVMGNQTYTAPDIEGYINPDENYYTVNVFNDGDTFEHTFIYKKYIPTEIINIPDDNFRNRIKNALGLYSEDITTTDMAKLENLNIQNIDVIHFAGIEYAINLKNLTLRNNGLDSSNITEYLPGMTSLINLEISNNNMTDICSLAGLTQLKKLTLSGNGISDINALVNLVNLEEIDLGFNNIADITALEGLTNLKRINLIHNRVEDIEPLAGLVNLNWLMLDNNRIDFNLEPNKTIHGYFLSNLNYYQFSFQSPAKISTVTIHYQDDKGNTIKDTDVFTKRGDSYYIEAPIIEGYNVVMNGVMWFNVLWSGQIFEYTIVYKEVPIPNATVYIYYSDDKGMEIREGDVFYNVVETQTYIAPHIEGFIRPVVDTITFIVNSINQLFIHVFFYTELKPETTVILNYVNSEGITIKESDVYNNVTGAQTFIAPDIAGYIKPNIDAVTFSITDDGVLEHTFYYTEEPKAETIRIIINYVDGEGKNIKDSDTHNILGLGTHIYTAPDIEGYIKPDVDTVTFILAVTNKLLEHAFIYYETIIETPVVEQPVVEPPVKEETVVETELIIEPEPVVEPESVVETELVDEPKPVDESELVVETELVDESETVVEPQTADDSQPVVETEPTVALEPVVESKLAFESKSIIESVKPVVELVAEPAIEEVDEPVIEPEPVVEQTDEPIIEKPIEEPVTTINTEPEGKEKLPLIPITAVGGLFLVIFILQRKKNLKIYAVENAAGDEVERLLSKRRIKVHSDKVVIDISKELVELIDKKLKIVLSKSLSTRLLNKTIIFKNNNNYFSEITLIELIDAIEITKDNIISVIKK